MRPTRTALITGASAGIGQAFARELAQRGYHLVITARRVERLQQLATELHQAQGVQVTVMASDLADAGAAEALCADLEAQHIHIDMLVNNAGYGVPGTFEQSAWKAHEDFLQVLVRAPTELAHRLLPAMRQCGYGRIINVASLAGHLPGSVGHTLYAAAKAYMIRFSQSLALENWARGVHVCALCPGFTYSEFHDVTGARELVSRLPRWMWMDADTVARQGLDAVERGEVVYINGRINRLIKAVSELMPSRLAMRLSQRHSHRYRDLAD
ncbi:SDR family oxidoreductase [Oleiagrimonas sp. C23AA]|uniref:SDR family NAD(P)-dependent oxidoreductase n=1 Tax=Oleiagrimonas sp. C23AA TaxID=2719047 RepID=UPI0014209307|nr:SDR family oxidoreductase [Oleiagrimonas sp. C23AA]NII10481.1 SDR family oxidoreductase [Oleiagrimonas sp. C23AA]